VSRLSRRPGQKEERWAHLLAGEATEMDTDSGGHVESDAAADAVRSVSLGDAVASLRADVDALREEVQRINAIVEELRSAFDL
jgi:uncharacterized protein YceH (UPF0502 family)